MGSPSTHQVGQWPSLGQPDWCQLQGLLEEHRVKVLGEDGAGFLESHCFPTEAAPGAWLVCGMLGLEWWLTGPF